MRYSEIRRDPREDERELAKKIRPAKPRPSREINPIKAHEIRIDANGQRSKHITLRSLNAHRQWRDAREREMAKDNEDLPSMYGVDLEDREQKKSAKRSKSEAQKREDRIKKQIERGLASRRKDRKATLKAAVRGSNAK
jgi:hypothetical protein